MRDNKLDFHRIVFGASPRIMTMTMMIAIWHRGSQHRLILASLKRKQVPKSGTVQKSLFHASFLFCHSSKGI